MRSTYALRILGVFLALFITYLVIAYLFFAPLAYYGSLEEPRFSDRWIERAETIVQGGQLYRDVTTTTPPLTNFLLVIPVLLSGLFDHRNPWATLAFMSFFALFNLFTAYVLLYTPEDRRAGFYAALYFLLNPLTFGNAVLRRQDESILVFFCALALMFVLRQRAWKAGATLGAALLVKLTAALLIPIAFLRTRDWRYLAIPPIVFGVAFMPFLLASGESAVFWDLSKTHTEHPFQLGGISIGALWFRMHGGDPERLVRIHSVLLVVGVAAALLLIIMRPSSLLRDMSLLTATVLLFTPKLHCGYFSLLAMMLAPLVHKSRAIGLYFLFGVLPLIADFQKWPHKNYPLAVNLIAGVSLLIVAIIAWLRWPAPGNRADRLGRADTGGVRRAADV